MAYKDSDLIGKRSGKLTLVARAEDGKDSRGYARKFWLCKCECGNEKVIDQASLTHGRTVSCGCYRLERCIAEVKKHGEGDTKLYKVWCGMKERCSNKNYLYYSCYGGRGISVCSEWQKDYKIFRDWALSNGYKEGLTLERINVNGNYEPLNCCFVTRQEQGKNKRNNRIYVAWGESKTQSEWLRDSRCKVKCGTFRSRLKTGWETEAALSVSPFPIGLKRRDMVNQQ